MTRRIAPSILAADFGRLREEVTTVIDAGATVIHVDVMDGHFVPPITMGPNAVEALRDLGALLDVHLMIERPERQIADFAKAGAGTITIHAESTPHIDYVLEHIRAAGCRASLAVNPSTPLDVFREVDVDQALCMTVNPAGAGRRSSPARSTEIARLRALIGEERRPRGRRRHRRRDGRPVRRGGGHAVRRRNRDIRRPGPRRGLRRACLQDRV